MSGYTELERLKAYPAESFNERVEKILSFKDHMPIYQKKGVRNDRDPRNNFLFVRGRWEDGKHIRQLFLAHNLITTHGRQYYAKRGAIESPAANEGATRMQLANPSSQNSAALGDTWDQFDNPNGAAISNSNITFTSGYPKTNDNDAENTGAGLNVVSYQAFFAQGIATAASVFIKNAAIHDQSSPVNTTKIVAHALTTDSAGIQKNATDTLKGMLNHTVSSS